MEQLLNATPKPVASLSQKYRDRLLARLATDPDFSWAVECVLAAGTGGTIELTVASNGRLKAVGTRLRREARD